MSAADLPGPPTNVRATDVHSKSITISWSAPTKDGGAPIAGYYVERRTGLNPRWVAVNREPIHILTMLASDLSEGRQYEFRVTAENEVGIGKPSDVIGPLKAEEPHG